MMAFARKKRVTDPFDDKARARLVGADHRHVISGDGDSLSLSDLVHGFLEEDNANNGGDELVANELESDQVNSVGDRANSVGDSFLWRRLSIAPSNNADPYKNTLLMHVSEAMDNFAFSKEQNVSVFRRSVTAFLREKGHDAAVCKTAWESSDGLTAGSHEFIDVAQYGSSTWRYFVDLDFRTQFEIARPTLQFSEVLSSVPGIFVGGAVELKRTVSIMCDAAKRCFKNRGLSVPPWRKNRFMQNKWFGPCHRTANPVLEKPVQVAVKAVNGVRCRLVGFDDVVSETRRGGGVVVRTR